MASELTITDPDEIRAVMALRESVREKTEDRARFQRVLEDDEALAEWAKDGIGLRGPARDCPPIVRASTYAGREIPIDHDRYWRTDRNGERCSHRDPRRPVVMLGALALLDNVVHRHRRHDLKRWATYVLLRYFRRTKLTMVKSEPTEWIDLVTAVIRRKRRPWVSTIPDELSLLGHYYPNHYDGRYRAWVGGELYKSLTKKQYDTLVELERVLKLIDKYEATQLEAA